MDIMYRWHSNSDEPEDLDMDILVFRDWCYSNNDKVEADRYFKSNLWYMEFRTMEGYEE